MKIIPTTRQLLVFFLFCLSFAKTTQANQFLDNTGELDSQRNFYQQLGENVRSGRIHPEKYIAQLGSYPLFPYLKYYQLLANVSSSNLDQFNNFFELHDDLAVSSHLRKQLLILLGTQQDWLNFEHFYKPADYYLSDRQLLEIHCFHLEAQLFKEQQHGPADTAFYYAIREVWLTGNSLPNSCNSVIEIFTVSGFLTQTLNLDRIRLAISNNNTALANFLSRQLDEAHLQQFRLWEALVKQPRQLIDSTDAFSDTFFVRFAITQALMKILQEDPPLALTLWKEQKARYQFTEDEIISFTEEANMYLIIKNSEHLIGWFEIANPKHKNALLNEKELVLHIKNRDWPAIISLYEKITAAEKRDSMWQYWFSRSHIEYDQNADIHPNAWRVLDELSRKRDYYGFLASFHLNKAPVLSHHSFPLNDKALQKIAAIPAIQRAHEFYILQDFTNANLEWFAATQHMTEGDRGTAAVLAMQWGWHEQAIRSAVRSTQFNNMTLRFPTAYSPSVGFHASKHSIPVEWVYSIIRQESAYSINARSSAGAMGLMQIMPATGTVLARENKIRNFRTDQLLEPELNIELGTYYLGKLRKQYDGNLLLASAAYNAGASRVNTWIKNYPDLEIEMWIETIPFKETRGYVKNIFTYQIIYQHLLGREHNAEHLFLPIPVR